MRRPNYTYKLNFLLEGLEWYKDGQMIAYDITKRVTRGDLKWHHSTDRTRVRIRLSL